ncbi:MAG: hypothetical protein M3P49_17240 [Actinomycetota bacterium]|nr:hypothetical protein [Actinomycetota bacterium]
MSASGSPDRDSLIRKALYKAWGSRHELCLYPDAPACTNKASAAHSIQNNGTLSELSHAGHVYMIETRPMIGEKPELPDFEKRGRNQATTFKGLCNPHDSELFRPIDNNPLNLNDPEHVFLLTYRSALKEAHASEHSSRVVASVYADLVRDGVLSPGSHLDAAAEAKPGEDADALMKEKRKLDELHLVGGHNEVTHEVVALPGRSPSLAVSGYFSAGSTNGRERWCALNVFPSNGDHLMVFSYRRFNELAVRTAFLNALGSAKGRDRERVASSLILEYSSNFVVRPSLVEAYTPAQRSAIRNYFWGSTTLQQASYLEGVRPGWGAALAEEVVEITGGIDKNDPRLNLFETVA